MQHTYTNRDQALEDEEGEIERNRGWLNNKPTHKVHT